MPHGHCSAYAGAYRILNSLRHGMRMGWIAACDSGVAQTSSSESQGSGVILAVPSHMFGRTDPTSFDAHSSRRPASRSVCRLPVSTGCPLRFLKCRST